MSHAANIRSRILIPLSLTFLVLLCSFLYSAFAIRGAGIANELEREHGETISIFKGMLSARTRLMTAAAEIILKDPALKQAMRSRNRAGLYAAALPYQRKLTTNDVTHFYFHTPDSKNFLRVHQPDRYGDLINRDSMQRAVETGDAADALEMGPFGTLTLRLVIPWHDQSGLIGYLELGTEVNDILDDLAIINNIDYLVVLNKELLDKKTMATGYAWVGRKVDWERYPDKVVIAQSIPSIPPALDHQLAEETKKLSRSRAWNSAALGNQHYAFRTFPFHESSGREIGNFILLYDITNQTRSFHHFIIYSLCFSCGISIILFMFAWKILGRVEQTIEETRQKLSEEVDKTSEANNLLETEIAERQKAEEALVHLNSHLEERIAERTRHLEAATEALELGRHELEKAYAELTSRQAIILHQDKMASIGLLAAGVAHDINNPIGFVTNNLEELSIYLTRLQAFIEEQQAIIQATASPEELKKLHEDWNQLGIDYILDDFGALIAESLEGATRVSDIVKNLRNFSRVDDFAFKQADINECLENSIKITHHELRHKAQVHRQFGEIPKILCCPQQLNQAFMNLLVNAAHAIDKRGDVTLKSWSDADSVHISITDTGCGIPENLQPQIFEPFFTTKEAGKGTGLGLSIVADIIKLHQGEISVQSRPGQGTTFTITLPTRPEVGDA
ncbi:GHKL domain-containing protein [Trichlorobacter lovleyi]|uniref:sensor histidine kinase n=1 Tax=Trichlorobacter lovleyi TaxID=313985 RepID=UPI0022409590|nr:ATP-binding protein [Trichlorobacter lovleyi]QOX79323.1 GHKL domain-containing protein [Trichlorobacter lovleyi]